MSKKRIKPQFKKLTPKEAKLVQLKVEGATEVIIDGYNTTVIEVNRGQQRYKKLKE